MASYLTEMQARIVRLEAMFEQAHAHDPSVRVDARERSVEALSTHVAARVERLEGLIGTAAERDPTSRVDDVEVRLEAATTRLGQQLREVMAAHEVLHGDPANGMAAAAGASADV